MFGALGKQRGKIVAIADVGSGSVAVGIAEIEGDGRARVLISERAALASSDRDSDAAIIGTISLLEETAQKTLTAYGQASKRAKHVDAAFATIHAPWARSKTIRAESRLQHDTKVDRQMIASLGREALQKDGEFDQASMLEAGVIRTELNGYATLNPVGKHAVHIAASSLLSQCEPRIKEGVANALAKVFACPPPTLRSDTRAILSATRESSSLPKEALVVNMSYEATNVIVVRKGIVAETTLVQEGSSTIIKRIAGATMPEEALTLIRLLALDQCEKDACEAISTAIANIEPELAKTFGEAFARVSAARRLPNRLTLLTHQDLAPWLSHFFGRLDFAQFTATTRPFIPTALSMDSIKELVTFDAAPDISLGVTAALVNMEIRASQ